ncbi:glycosyltransferase involved in cell wall biosynthesis [Nitrospirillum amazonense]|uniref:Glycosyltransferase involved in cell wall biosynthesis n=1 Tax=Nitrospirillum amazonense TaxID=28077 RepID=A0A560JIC0_9PROT|nr:glycosyltransferase [Nitrospirillum amazonense]TWB70766.1 glycosyltransferase involved in cell wall biosynthesis [Nitrospirillum amazonense]
MFRVLLLHKDFPGQFRPLALSLLADPRVEVRGLGQREEWRLPGLTPQLYRDMPAVAAGTHPYLVSAADHVIRGQCALRDAVGMAQQGYRPDLIIGHCGFGDTLYLKDLWPDVPLVGYFEFYYHSRGADVGFDPLFPVTLDDLARVRTLNVVNLLGLEAADLGVCPTEWQRSLHPAAFRDRLQVMHEGIDTDLACPGPVPAFALPDGTVITQGDEVVTYVARDLEPYRGFHVFMRALPEILRRRPRARVVVAGGDGVSYGPPPAGGGTWREHLMAEVGPALESSRVHFLGPVDHGRFLDLMRLSSAHVYLTYPFVLSWSMLEAMACGVLLVASDTPPVAEVVRDGVNGLLFPFFDTGMLASRVVEALDRGPALAPLRQRARETVRARFDARTQAVPAWRQALARFGCPAPAGT